MPSGDFSRPVRKVSRKPPRRVDRPVTRAPVTDVQSGSQRTPGHPYRSAPTPPPPSWTRPVRRVTVQPPRARSPYPKKIGRITPIWAHDPRALAAIVNRQTAIDAQKARIRSARRQILPVVGPFPPAQQLHDSIPQFSLGSSVRMLRDSGPAGQSPTVRGVVLSPQQIGHDVRDLFRFDRGGQSRILERLQAAGLVRGQTTDLQRQENEAARRAAAVERAWQVQMQSDRNQAVIGVPKREFVAALRGFSSSDINRITNDYLNSPKIQREGIDPSSLTGLIAGTANAIGDTAHAVAGKGFLGNAAADVATLPIGAVNAAVQTAQDPAVAWQSLKSGFIGTWINHGWDAALRYAHQHPVFAGLELAGGVTGVGRSIGAVGRTVSRGRVFSTERAPLALTDVPGTRAVHLRRYSKDVFRQAGQRGFDRLLKDGPAAEVYGKTVRSKVSPSRHHTEWRTRKLADYIASRANSRERVHREELARAVQRAAPVRQHRGGKVGQAVGGVYDRVAAPAPRYGEAGHHPLSKVIPGRVYRPERDVVSMVLEGVVRSRKTFVADLKKERARLETEYQRHVRAARAGNTAQVLDKTDVLANRERAKAIDRVLKDPKAVRNANGVFAAAERLAPMFRSLEEEAIARGALHPTRAARSKLFPFAQSHLGAEYRDGQLRPPVDPRVEAQIQRVQALADRAGTPGERAAAQAALRRLQAHRQLTNRQVLEEFAKQGGNPELLTYLPHHVRLRGPAAFHQHFGQSRRNYEGAHTRTGELFRRGASPYDYHHVLESLVGKSSVLGNIREYDHLLQTVGVRHADGRYLTAKEAHRWIKQGHDDHGRPLPPRLVAKRAFNSRVSPDQLAKIEREQNVIGAQPSSLLEQHYRDRAVLPDDSSRARNVVLVPETIDRRLAAHIGVAGKQIGFQTLNSLFRRAVLPLSVKWLTGNVLEAVLRSVTAGTVPVRDNLLGRKVVRALISQDMRAGKAFEAEMTGGLFIGQRGLTNRRGPSLHDVPVVNEFVKTLKLATDAGFAFNRMLEREFQYAVIGKYARQQMQEMTGSWFKAMRAQRQALDDLARGLKGTPAQVQAARYMDEVLGQYGRFSPKVRGIIQTYTPFLPWYLNSLRFVFWTLPAHHTFKTALLTSVERQLQSDYNSQHSDTLTRHGDLATAVKAKDGGWVDAARYTPFGFTGQVLAGGPQALQPAASLVLPQFSGAYLAAMGLDPYGQSLEIPKKYGGGKNMGLGDIAGIVGNTFAESTLPGLSIARRLREHGQTALPDSTVFEPHTKGPASAHGQSAAERIFDPFREIYLRTAQSSATGRGGPGSAFMREASTRAKKSQAKGSLGMQRFLLEAAKRARAAQGGG